MRSGADLSRKYSQVTNIRKMQVPHKQQHTTRQRPVKLGHERKEHTQKTNKLRHWFTPNIQRVTSTQRPQIQRGKNLQGPLRRSHHWVIGRWDSANHSLWGELPRDPSTSLTRPRPCALTTDHSL